LRKKNHSICIHYDIFQNDSNIINNLLQINFQKFFVKKEDTKNPDRIISWTKVFDYFKDQPLGVKAFSSTQVRPPIPEQNSIKLIPMVFIRHPIDRTLSIFSFRKKWEYRNLKNNSNLTLSSFIKNSLLNKNYNKIKNFQVNFLSSNKDTLKINSNNYDLAIGHLKNIPIIGLVDQLEKSLVLAEEMLKPYFDKINFSFSEQHRDINSKDELSHTIEKCKSEIGNDLMKKLIEQNKFDLLLHAEATKELEKRISKIDDFELKLLNFKRRCKDLESKLITDKKAEKLLKNAPEFITVHDVFAHGIPQSLQFMIDILPTVRELIQNWNKSKILRVLDVGANTGAGTNLLSALHRGYFFGVKMEVEALDINNNFEQFANEYFPNINYIVGDIFKIPQNRTWDMIISSHVIEHFEDPFSFIHKIQNHARKWALFYTPFEEEQLHRAHKFRYTKKIINSLQPQITKILKSPAWFGPTGKEKCILFVLNGKAK